MGWFSNLIGRDKVETKVVDFSPELWAAINGGWGLPTKSGQSVSTTSALQCMPFFRGVVAIAEGIAQLPVEIYRELPDGKGAEPAKDHPLYDVLLNQANNVQDSFQFFRTTLMHAVGAGNGVSYKNIVQDQVRELIPVRPECVSIDIEPMLYRQVFDITFEKGNYARVGKDQVFHIAGPSWSHYKGLDPAVVGREALGLAQVIEESHARLHANSARPSGVLETEQKLDEPYVTRLREQWRQVMSGSAKTGETAIVGGGLKWKQVSQTAVDAEHLDTRKHQIEEIARLLGIFPIMLGHAGDQSPTFASAEAFFAAHVRYSLQPWIKAIRLAIQTQLLTKAERAEGYYCRIDTSELLRGSLKDRSEYYKAALGTSSSPGWLKPNEVREDDGWNADDDPAMDEIIKPFDKQTAVAGAGADNAAKPEGVEAKSIAPRTLYVSRRLLNADEFLKWAKSQGFKTTLAASDLHVTIAFSRARIDWMKVEDCWSGDREGGLTVRAGGPRVVEPIGTEGAVALKFGSTELSCRHMAIREAGATWDHPEYQPHVTITYDASGVDLSKVEPYRGELRFGPEIFAELDLEN